MSTTFKASIIIPTRHRTELLLKRLETIIANTPELANNTAELLIALDIDDKEAIEAFSKHPNVSSLVYCMPEEIPCRKWNNAMRFAFGEWLVTLSDDCVPEPNWLTNALNYIGHSGFLGLPDQNGIRNNDFTPLYMATKEWLKKYHGGVLVIPHYKSWYADIETAIRAKKSGTYEVAWNSKIIQLHSVFGTATDDEIYKIGERRRIEDLRMFNLRASKNFPDDFEKVI